MAKDKVCIIICNHKAGLLERCLKSLKQVHAQKIVVTSDPNISAGNVFTSKNQPTYKRNLGTKLTNAEYLCFLDDDIEIKEDCIDVMMNYLDTSSDVGMVYATLYKMDNHNVIDTSGSFLTWSGFLYETYEKRVVPTPILSGKSACCMIRKDLFWQIGRFDEDFVIYGEETDLSWRVWLAGYKVMVLPSAVAYHAFETPLKPKNFYNPYYIHYHGCKNYLTMLIKDLPANKLYMVLINASIWFITGLSFLFKNRTATKLIWKGIWYNIINFPYIWGKRKRIKREHFDFKLICKNPPLHYYFNRLREYIKHELHG